MSEDQITKLLNSMQNFRTEMIARFDKTDARFDKTDARFDKTDARFDKTASEDQLKKLFKYTSDHFSDIEKKLDEKASQSGLDRLTNTIDSFVKRLDDADIEQSSRDLQFDRLLSWAKQVSKKTGIPLANL